MHFSLFNKIKLHEELEEDLVKGFRDYLGDYVYTIEDTSIQRYGEKIPDKPLEELINANNIHNWLQERVDIAETRQVAILAKLFAKYKENRILLAKNIYEQNGIVLGRDSKTNYNVSNPNGIYDN